MPSRIDIGPDGGPFVELDEDDGEFIIRVPQDQVDFDAADLANIGALNATSGTFDSVSTEEGQITGETFVSGWRDNNTDSISAGEYGSVFDAVRVDNRDEISGETFTPDKSGWYDITGSTRITGTSDSRIEIRVEDVDADSTIDRFNTTVDTNGDRILYAFTSDLSSGVSYQIQVTVEDDSFIIDGGAMDGTGRNIVIKRSPVQPGES